MATCSTPDCPHAQRYGADAGTGLCAGCIFDTVCRYLLRLTWDVTGEAFDQRHAAYEAVRAAGPDAFDNIIFQVNRGAWK